MKKTIDITILKKNITHYSIITYIILTLIVICIYSEYYISSIYKDKTLELSKSCELVYDVKYEPCIEFTHMTFNDFITIVSFLAVLTLELNDDGIVSFICFSIVWIFYAFRFVYIFIVYSTYSNKPALYNLFKDLSFFFISVFTLNFIIMILLITMFVIFILIRKFYSLIKIIELEIK